MTYALAPHHSGCYLGQSLILGKAVHCHLFIAARGGGGMHCIIGAHKLWRQNKQSANFDMNQSANSDWRQISVLQAPKAKALISSLDP